MKVLFLSLFIFLSSKFLMATESNPICKRAVSKLTTSVSQKKQSTASKILESKKIDSEIKLSLIGLSQSTKYDFMEVELIAKASNVSPLGLLLEESKIKITHINYGDGDHVNSTDAQVVVRLQRNNLKQFMDNIESSDTVISVSWGMSKSVSDTIDKTKNQIDESLKFPFYVKSALLLPYKTLNAKIFLGGEIRLRDDLINNEYMKIRAYLKRNGVIVHEELSNSAALKISIPKALEVSFNYLSIPMVVNFLNSEDVIGMNFTTLIDK